MTEKDKEPGPGKAPDPDDPFDAEIRNRISEKARLEFQKELVKRERLERKRREKAEESRRERASLPEKLEKATQIIEIARQFWRKEVFMEILNFFESTAGASQERRYMLGRYRTRVQDFGRRWYRAYDGRIVIWCRENPLLDERRMLALGEDGALFYVEVSRGVPASFGRNERWIYSTADMAQALSRDQIDEIYRSISAQSIEELVTWQMDEEINRNRGQLARGDVKPDDDDDQDVYDEGYTVFDDEDDDS